MIELILDTQNIEQALDHLLGKNDTIGVDGMRLSDLPVYIQNNMLALRASILDGSYRPGLVQELEIIDSKGKIRVIAKLNAVDRLILRAVHQVLHKELSPIFSRSSFAYQDSKGVVPAVRQAADHIAAGFEYVVSLDIEQFFDNILHYKMGELLLEFGLDRTTNGLIQKFLNCNVVRDFEILPKEKGLIQGSSLSPLLSNLYLHKADLFFCAQQYKFCRFADDIKLFAKSFEEGLEIYGKVKQFLESELHLNVNKQKSGVFPAIDRVFLGYRFYLFPNGKIEIKKNVRNPRRYMHNWQSSSIQKIGGEYHLISDGILTRKDYNLLFENPEKKMHLPVESAECLNLYSNITFSSSFFSFAANKNLQINLFSRFGEYEGTFIPKQTAASSSLSMQQTLVYVDAAERLELARQFAMAAAHNLRENLKYYARHNHSVHLSHAIEAITEIIQKENVVKNVTFLMLLEGHIRSIYYACLNDIIINEDFYFTKRTKRPPRDPLNSLISYGNTVLYRKIAKEIYKSRLDIRFGFLHATNRRYESLNLDIAEIFRPVIVDRVIFTLINKKMINAKMHFEDLEGGAVYLNSEGKKIFIAELERKLAQRLKHKAGITSYEGLIRVEIQKLTRRFDKGEPYKAYKYFL